MSDNLGTLRKIAEAATPGPWEMREENPQMDGRNFTVRVRDQAGIRMSTHCYGFNGDPEFIATFDPPTVLALLSRLEQAEQAVERAKAECARQREHKGIFARRATEAEQAVQRVREVCESDSYDMHKDYGNGELAVPVDSIMYALDGESNA